MTFVAPAVNAAGMDVVGRQLNLPPSYGVLPDSYRPGTWRLAPSVVLAWNVLYQDATRFTLAERTSHPLPALHTRH